MDWLNQALFGFYPYVALAVLAIGSILRFDREQYTWRTGSSQLLRRRQLVLGSILFHVGILAIFAGHFVGLLTPIWVWDTLGVSHGAKQMLAIVAGGAAGAGRGGERHPDTRFARIARDPAERTRRRGGALHHQGNRGGRDGQHGIIVLRRGETPPLARSTYLFG